MPKCYYIDGYNVLYKSSTLRPLAEEDIESARESLIDKVVLFCRAVDATATIVFDGRGTRYTETADHGRNLPGLQVLYTHGSLSADAVIERMVYQAKDRREIAVVSNDRGIRMLCRGMGALVMEADNFLQEVRGIREDIDRSMDRIRQPTSMERVEERLDPDMIDKLRALRDQLRDT